MNISTALLVTDLIVVILAFLIFDTLTGLCSVLGLIAKTLLIDKTIERMKLNKFFYDYLQQSAADLRFHHKGSQSQRNPLRRRRRLLRPAADSHSHGCGCQAGRLSSAVYS